MTNYKTITQSLSTLPSILPSDLKAVFVGATTGIGQSVLLQFARATASKSPTIYIVGRNAATSAPLVATLRSVNSRATVVFVEQDVSLIKGVDEAVIEIKKSGLARIDYLIMSVGFISFNGRKETAEGLDPSMTTRYYSRARFIHHFIPLLNASPNPHVLNVLAGGQEVSIVSSDLDLKDPRNYSIRNASIHSATMLTLTLERYAAANPRISFVHAYPGLVATPTLSRATGIVGFLLRWVVSPIVMSLFATSVEEAGARMLFYATNARYTVDETKKLAAPIPNGLQKAEPSQGGVFLVSNDSEAVHNEALLKELRDNHAVTVWEHTLQTWNAAVGN